VAPFRPGIGIEHEDSRQDGVGQRRDQRAGVAGAQPDIVELFPLDRRQRLGEAVVEGLGAEKADVAMRRRLGDQMLAAAKADFEPDFAWGERKQRRAIEPRRRADFQPRQQVPDQRRLAAAQGLAMGPAIERAPLAGIRTGSGRGFVFSCGDQETRRLKSPARSVRSQEKPPSASGLRPKWP
jgi:hypothetical protein